MQNQQPTLHRSQDWLCDSFLVCSLCFQDSHLLVHLVWSNWRPEIGPWWICHMLLLCYYTIPFVGHPELSWRIHRIFQRLDKLHRYNPCWYWLYSEFRYRWDPCIFWYLQKKTLISKKLTCSFLSLLTLLKPQFFLPHVTLLQQTLRQWYVWGVPIMENSIHQVRQDCFSLVRISIFLV